MTTTTAENITVKNAPRVTVELRPWEYELVARVGAARTARNLHRPDAPHYDRSRMEDDRTAQHAAAAAECAVARATNQYWTAGGAWDAANHRDYRHLADVGTNTEVRRIREDFAATFAFDKEKDASRIIVACYVEPPELHTVRIFGWIRGEDALTHAGSRVAKEYPNRLRVPIAALTLDGLETTLRKM